MDSVALSVHLPHFYLCPSPWHQSFSHHSKISFPEMLLGRMEGLFALGKKSTRAKLNEEQQLHFRDSACRPHQGSVLGSGCDEGSSRTHPPVPVFPGAMSHSRWDSWKIGCGELFGSCSWGNADPTGAPPSPCLGSWRGFQHPVAIPWDIGSESHTWSGDTLRL